MFYTFKQNNSGGSFIVDNKVAHYVCIEADTEPEALDIAENIGIYFNGVDDGYDCPCCGDRWSTWVEKRDKPHAYGVLFEEWTTKGMNKDFGIFNYELRIHYKNGQVAKSKMEDIVK